MPCARGIGRMGRVLFSRRISEAPFPVKQGIIRELKGTLQTDSSRRFFFANPFPRRRKTQPAPTRARSCFRLPSPRSFCERVAAFTVSWPGLSRPRAQRASSAPAIFWQSAGRSAPPARSVFTMSKSKVGLDISPGGLDSGTNREHFSMAFSRAVREVLAAVERSLLLDAPSGRCAATSPVLRTGEEKAGRARDSAGEVSSAAGRRRSACGG